jgi:hypothetical protein
MNCEFDSTSKHVTLDMSMLEWEMLMVLRHASIRYITPLKEGSNLANAIDSLDRINHQIIMAMLTPTS